MIAFGIDPGSIKTGWGIVRVEGSSLTWMGSGVIRIDAARALHSRLTGIFDPLRALLDEFKPEKICLESIFHHRSAKSALVLGHARGVALLAAGLSGCDVCEVTPAEVKKAVTGNGRAEKEQVQEMVRLLLALRDPQPLDASDALAVAIAGATKSRFSALVRATREG